MAGRMNSALRASDEPPETRRGSPWRTPSNALTLLRFLSAMPLACLILLESWGLAVLVFWLAVASDVADGRIARARGESSALGGFLDHATDAFFVASGLHAISVAGAVPVWLAPLVVAAFAQYALDSRTSRGEALRASSLGRWNGILYFFPIGIMIHRGLLGLEALPIAWVHVFGWVLVGSTLASMADRAWALLRSTRTRG